VRVRKEFAQQIRIVSTAAGEETSDYLDRLLTPIVERDLRKFAQSRRPVNPSSSAPPAAWPGRPKTAT
jgi:hypothetical protein